MTIEVEKPPSRWPPMSYWIRVTVTVMSTAAVLLAARSVLGILVLVVIALVLAIGLEPAVRGLGRLRLGRRAATAVIFLSLVLFLGLFVALLVPHLVSQIRQFADAVPGYVNRLDQRQDWLGRLAQRYDASTKIKDFIGQLPARVGQSFGTILGFAGTLLGTAFQVLTVAILTIYFMLSGPRLRSTAAQLFSPQHRLQAEQIIEDAIDKIGGYVAGNLLTSAVCGAMTIIALLIMGVPYAVPLGMWAGFADLIPQFGSYLGAVPAVLIGLFQGPITGVIVLGFFIAYQQFENYLLAPKVMQNAIDLSPAAVIISTLIGGSLLGFAGALLAIPAAATIKLIITDVWLKGRSRADDQAPAPLTPSGQDADG